MNSPPLNAFSSLVRLAAVTLGLALTGCGAFDAAVDCNTICNRYKSCFDASYDVSACASRCRDRAANDSATANAVNRCEACINDRACTSATFNCSVDCGNVVP
jgi:hypothetical protein